MTDQEIDPGKNLMTQAEIIRMLKKENADLKERLKSMEAQLSRLTDAVMQSNAKQTASEDAGAGFCFLILEAGAEVVHGGEGKIAHLQQGHGTACYPHNLTRLIKPRTTVCRSTFDSKSIPLVRFYFLPKWQTTLGDFTVLTQT